MPVPTRSQAVCFWGGDTRPGAPEYVMYLSPAPSVSAESAAQYPPPKRCFTLMPAMRLRHGSRGRVRLASPDPLAGPRIETNFFADPGDVRSALSAVAMAREVGNSAALRPFAKREVPPASCDADTLDLFLRNAVETYWHQSSTAGMGRDADAVVDARLRVYGIDGLRVADVSVLPHVTVANTMAPHDGRRTGRRNDPSRPGLTTVAEPGRTRQSQRVFAVPRRRHLKPVLPRRRRDRRLALARLPGTRAWRDGSGMAQDLRELYCATCRCARSTQRSAWPSCAWCPQRP
ncbi:GMC oxidoreductase [Streptomyces sp. NRRL F-5755]|uniref:GMC oxidoreductase n=1 Tax=Streptomyces sp. NRRL F-5755 TaxID=1519475 RepID=UPI00099D5AEF|nr:GMC oxidoreductase [Streptomyces sp. NRRL F-5755]